MNKKENSMIFYGIMLGAIINYLLACSSKLVDHLASLFDAPYWIMVTIGFIMILVIWYFVFFRIRRFPRIKWFHILFFVLLGALYLFLTAYIPEKYFDYFEANRSLKTIITPIRSILNLGTIILALIKYYSLSSAQKEE